MDKTVWRHQAVLKEEVLTYLNVKSGETYVDATIGAAGHSREIIAAGGKVIGFEIDSVNAERVEKEKIVNLEVVNTNFTKIAEILKQEKIGKVAGVLFDLGISSDQLADSRLGLSFATEAPLDMRLSPDLGVTAADLVNALAERQLYELFNEYGEERFARRVARALVNARRKEKITTTSQLTRIVEEALGGKRGKIHPATKIFMALRIAVNDELNNLQKGLEQATAVLKQSGRLVVISFHSLEDRIVKNFLSTEPSLQVLTVSPAVPSPQEIAANPRSRSAKLRAAEKI